jgi:hypothetical protein
MALAALGTDINGMAHGAWRMGHGAWRMAHGAWRMARGAVGDGPPLMGQWAMGHHGMGKINSNAQCPTPAAMPHSRRNAPCPIPNPQCPYLKLSFHCYNVCRGRSPPCQPRHRCGATTGGLTIQFHPFDVRRRLEAGFSTVPVAGLRYRGTGMALSGSS